MTFNLFLWIYSQGFCTLPKYHMLCDGTEILTMTFNGQFIALGATWNHNAACIPF